MAVAEDEIETHPGPFGVGVACCEAGEDRCRTATAVPIVDVQTIARAMDLNATTSHRAGGPDRRGFSPDRGRPV